MCLQQFLKLNELLKIELKYNFDLIVNDLKFLNYCKTNNETIYSLSTTYDLDRRSTYKRLRKLEERGYIKRGSENFEKKKTINLTKDGVALLDHLSNLENLSINL